MNARVPTPPASPPVHERAHTPTAEPMPLWKAGLVGGIAAIAINVALHALATLLGLFPGDVLVPGLERPIGLAMVVGATAAAALLQTVGFALVRLVMGIGAASRRTFRGIVYVVAVVSMGAPPRLDGATVLMILILEIMHVVAALVPERTLTIRSRRTA